MLLTSIGGIYSDVIEYIIYRGNYVAMLSEGNKNKYVREKTRPSRQDQGLLPPLPLMKREVPS